MAMQDGHRGRMKARFLQEGLDHFDERYVLEMLLFYCIPRKDTKPLACLLLEHFGSLKSVLEASAEEVKRLSKEAAELAKQVNASEFLQELITYLTVREN